MRVVGLGGGIGAARLWQAMVAVLPPEDLTLVVNTADDLWHHGLRVCPDLDTTLYALSGRQDTTRGWGVRGETWAAMDALRSLGEDVWFNLGDRDLGTHLLRTGLLHAGHGLAEITSVLALGMGVSVRVLPMTEAEVATRVATADGEMHYEEFLVRYGAMPPVLAVRYEGLADARPTPGVLEAIDDADIVVLGPSNPRASIDPILGLAGVREAVRDSRADVVAVTPVVTRVPVAGTGEERRARARASLLVADGVAATATEVAARYSDLGARFVLDAADAEEFQAIHDTGMPVEVVGTLLHRGDPPGSLLHAVFTPSSRAHRSMSPLS